MPWQKKTYREVHRGIKDIFPRLWRYCLLLTGATHHADDLAQSTCLKALEKSDNFQLGTNLDRWLFTIAKNMWLNERRAQAIRQSGSLSTNENVDILASRHTNPDVSIVHSDVLKSILQLPETQRIVVALVYIEGYSYKDASKILDIPIGTIMSRLSTARHKLSRQLTHYRDDVI